MNKDTIIHYTGYLLSALGALLGVSVLSYFVSPEVYGRVALYIAIGTLFQFIARESLGNAILRHSADICYTRLNLSALIKQFSAKLVVAGIAICALAWLIIQPDTLIESLLGLFLLISLASSAIGEAFLASIKNRTANAIHINIAQWFRFALALVFYHYWQASSLAILLGFSLGLMLSGIVDLISYFQLPKHNKQTQGPTLKLSIINPTHAILLGSLTWLLFFYDRLILEWLHGTQTLGIYSVLMQIGFMPVFLVMQASVSYFFPLVFAGGKINYQLFKRQYVALLCLAIAGVFTFLQFSHQWVFSWLVGEQYRDYSWLLPWLFISAIFNALAYFLQAFFFEQESFKKLVKIKALSALIFIISITLCSWLWAIKGLVLAHLISAVLLIFLTIGLLPKKPH